MSTIITLQSLFEKIDMQIDLHILWTLLDM